MDRTQLVHEMHQMQGVRLDVGEGNQTYILKDSAVKLVQDLRVTSSRHEKICIPQYVAEYIEKCKENNDISLFLAIRRGCSGSPEYIAIDRRVRKWFMAGGDACIEKFARAWVNEDLIEIKEEDWFLVTTSDDLEVQKISKGYHLDRKHNRVEGIKYAFDKKTAEALAIVFDGEIKEM